MADGFVMLGKPPGLWTLGAHQCVLPWAMFLCRIVNYFWRKLDKTGKEHFQMLINTFCCQLSSPGGVLLPECSGRHWQCLGVAGEPCPSASVNVSGLLLWQLLFFPWRLLLIRAQMRIVWREPIHKLGSDLTCAPCLPLNRKVNKHSFLDWAPLPLATPPSRVIFLLSPSLSKWLWEDLATEPGWQPGLLQPRHPFHRNSHLFPLLRIKYARTNINGISPPFSFPKNWAFDVQEQRILKASPGRLWKPYPFMTNVKQHKSSRMRCYH